MPLVPSEDPIQVANSRVIEKVTSRTYKSICIVFRSPIPKVTSSTSPPGM